MKQTIYQMDLLTGKYGGVFKTDIDTFILAAGSDYRAYEVLRNLIENGINIKNIIVFNFDERVSQLEMDDTYFDYKNIIKIKIDEIDCSIMNPHSALKQICDREYILEKTKQIVLDISCFTKPYFFYIIKLLKERFNILDLSVVYTEPQSYLFPKGVFNYYHSSTGPLSILEIPGFSGYEVRDDKRILIILLGFDGDLSKEINEDISPKETVVVNSFPGYIPKFKDISLIVNEKLTTNKNIKLAYSKANNPFEVFNLLEHIQINNKNSFINIAPLGTKPMALGACLFAMYYPKVRIVYPFPQAYKKVTTDKCWNSWQYKIHLFPD
jgi:hypothetical protein